MTHQNDPFFQNGEHFVVVPDSPELSNGEGVLQPEIVEWMIMNAPGAKFTYRRGTGSMGDDVFKLVFAFEKEDHLLWFKLRFQ